MNKIKSKMMTILAVVGLMVCVVIVSGCALTGPSGTGATTDPFNAELLAQDAQDVATVVALKEGRTVEKRARIARLAEQLEEASQNAQLTDAMLWALLEPAIGKVEDPDAALKIVAGKILLRRAGFPAGVGITAPEQVRAVAKGVANGLRAGLESSKLK